MGNKLQETTVNSSKHREIAANWCKCLLLSGFLIDCLLQVFILYCCKLIDCPMAFLLMQMSHEIWGSSSCLSCSSSAWTSESATIRRCNTQRPETGKNTHNTLGMFKIAIKNHRLFHMFRSVGKSSWVIYFNGPCTKPAKALRPSEDAKTQQGLTQQEQQEQQRPTASRSEKWSRLVFASRRIYVAILAAGTIDLYPLATAPSLYVSLYLSTNLPIYPCIHSSIRPSGHPIDLIYLIDLIYPISPICHIYPIYVLYPILSTLSILSALSMLSMLLIIHAWAF